MDESVILVLSILDQYVDGKIRLAEIVKKSPAEAEKLLNYEVEHILDTRERLGIALEMLANEQALEIMGKVLGFVS